MIFILYCYLLKLDVEQKKDIDTDDVSEEGETKKPKPVEEDIIHVKEKINSFRGDYKDLLYRLIEKRPDISHELEKMLDSWEK